jgi:acetyl esterase/lipase
MTLVMDVWPGEVPDDYGPIGEETFRPPWSEESKGAKWLTNVTKPTITVYRPAKEKDTGAAMLICPGGGYWNLAWDLEGEEVAAWLNSLGVTGIVLKYRVPRRPGQPEKLPAPGPLQDAQRAVSLVRSRAAEWGIDAGRIGMIGFSAGAHLTAATATQFDERAYSPLDIVDEVSCRPDFAILAYPGYLGETDPELLTPGFRVPADAPPFFLVHASDDRVARVENSVVTYLALKRAGISAELHLYAAGGHGFGIRKSGRLVSTWAERCAEWLCAQEVLRPSAGLYISIFTNHGRPGHSAVRRRSGKLMSRFQSRAGWGFWPARCSRSHAALMMDWLPSVGEACIAACRYKRARHSG